MQKALWAIVAVLLASAASAQGNESKLDLRFGAGRMLLGTGDFRATLFENEVNLRLSRYVAWSGGLGFAKSNNGLRANEQVSFLQLNTNFYLSPFRNTRRNDFRIGTGLSWYSVSDVRLAANIYENGQFVRSEYAFDTRSSLGFNVILENSYLIAGKLLLGLKLFTQPYRNGDLNHGIMLKVGVKV